MRRFRQRARYEGAIAPVTELRDYEAWLDRYDDPNSALSWRLATVRDAIDDALEAAQGPVRLLSACAGDGRDVIGVLARRADAGRVSVALLELHPAIAERARHAAAAASLGDVQVRTVDAGHSDAYLDLAPAHLVLLVGVFGNIDQADLHRTIAASPQLCLPGGRLIWTRGRGGTLTDCNDDVRARFTAARFTELDYCTSDLGSRPAVGVVRYDGPPVALQPAQRWFTFRR